MCGHGVSWQHVVDSESQTVCVGIGIYICCVYTQHACVGMHICAKKVKTTGVCRCLHMAEATDR